MTCQPPIESPPYPQHWDALISSDKKHIIKQIEIHTPFFKVNKFILFIGRDIDEFRKPPRPRPPPQPVENGKVDLMSSRKV